MSNLPPGLSESSLPGNTPEDHAWYQLHERIDTQPYDAAARRWDSQPDLLAACEAGLEVLVSATTCAVPADQPIQQQMAAAIAAATGATP